MATKTKDSEQRKRRIAALKQQAAEMAGGAVHAWESDTLPPDVQEQFWRSIVEVETAPLTTHFRQLAEAGVELPDPASLDDAQVTRTLWKVIDALATLRVFISDTDHLSDRELYAVLWNSVLREEVLAQPLSLDGAWHVQLLSGGSEEDTRLYLKYYADDAWRQAWLEAFPDYELPAHEDPPFDRDARLPQPY
jgi:hypothetical protein